VLLPPSTSVVVSRPIKTTNLSSKGVGVENILLLFSDLAFRKALSAHFTYLLMI